MVRSQGTIGRAKLGNDMVSRERLKKTGIIGVCLKAVYLGDRG